jgi:hypothetical protein
MLPKYRLFCPLCSHPPQGTKPPSSTTNLQAQGKEVTELGDRDSSFPLLANIQVHAKSCLGKNVEPLSQQQHTGGNSSACLLALHCFHGFGANLYSWAPCQKMMVRRAGKLLFLRPGTLCRIQTRHVQSSPFFRLRVEVEVKFEVLVEVHADDVKRAFRN